MDILDHIDGKVLAVEHNMMCGT